LIHFVIAIYKDASPTGLEKSAFNLWPEIQTPIAPIVHPKMNTGKEPFKCGTGSAPQFDFRQRQASCAAPAFWPERGLSQAAARPHTRAAR
jgi:hypothetical protein